jgi:acetyltransferase-like isoleucine patch superfamily enzyme
MVMIDPNDDRVLNNPDNENNDSTIGSGVWLAFSMMFWAGVVVGSVCLILDFSFR